MRTIRARHAIDDREPIDLRDRRALVGVHPCGARQLVGHRESTLDGEVRQRRVVLAHEHLECLAPMSGGGFQRRGPDVFLVDDRRHGEDVCLPGVVPGRQPCCRHRADLVEPDRERQLVGGPGAAPPPLHVGGLPHAAERISQASALQDRWSSRSAVRDPAAARVARPRSPSVGGLERDPTIPGEGVLRLCCRRPRPTMMNR